ncbi:hypothetical protein D3C86_1622350 [compost metagenome]
MFASAASSRADAPDTAPTAAQLAPPLVEYHQLPLVAFTPVNAMPVMAPLSASVTLSRPPAGGFRFTRLDTSVPTAPTGAPASSLTDARAGVAAALRTGASLVPAMVTVTTRLAVPSDETAVKLSLSD